MTTRRTLVTVLVLFVLAGGSLAGADGVPRAAAQTARVMVDLADAELPTGGTTTADVRVENVSSLWGGQIAVRYDPSVVQVVDEAGAAAEAIEGGDLLDPSHTTQFVNTVDRGRGIIEYAATLRNNPRRPVDPATGSGVLARIRLRAVGPGTTALAFSVEGATYVREIKFVDGDLDEFSLPTVDGELTVTGTGGLAIYLPMAVKDRPLRLAGGPLGRAARGAGAGRLPVSAPVGRAQRGVTGAKGLSKRLDAGVDVAPDRLHDVPERITETGQRVNDVAVAGGFVYWSEGPPEFGCASEADHGRISRVNIATGATEVLGHACDFDPGSLVVEGSGVYHVDAGDDSINSMNAEAGPGGARYTALLVRGNGLTGRSPLTLDATHGYFADEDGIKRWPRAGGDAELVTDHTTTALAIDDDYVYWIESGTPHGVYRVRKTGGAPETLYESDSRGWMGGIAVDDTHAYWSHTGGQARRVAKTGGTPEDYGPAGSWLSGGIAIDDASVFWFDEVRLRRAPKDRGTEPEAIALDMPGIKGLQTTDDGLFWAGGRPPDQGIWTLPLDASEVTVDLRINHIEVTQAVQDLWGNVPLVASKATLVRVYPASDWAYTHDVPLELRAFRDGAELAGSPLRPIVPTLSVRYDGARRERLDQTYNFLLPERWTEGTVDLRAIINHDESIPEANRTNNQLTNTFTFEQRDAMCLEMVQVRTEPASGSTRSAGFEDIVDWVSGSYPVPGVRYRRGGMVEELQVCWWGPFPYPCLRPFEMPNDSDKVLMAIWWYNAFSRDEAGCDTTFYAGMVHQDGIALDGTIGSSYVGGRELWAWMDTSPDRFGAAWPWFLPFGGEILAHELGHSLNRRHVDCGGPAAGSIDASYPYNVCDMGNDDPASFYGMDVLDMTVIPPTTAGDLMSYAHNDGKPEWVSDWTYRALMGALPGSAFAAADTGTGVEPDAASPTDALVASLAQAEEYLAVTGVVSPTEGTGAISVAKRLPAGLMDPSRVIKLASRIDSGPVGSHALLLRDANDLVLSRITFNPPEEVDAPDDVRTYQIILPFKPLTARITLEEGSTEVASLDVSPAPPTVEVLSPNGGETIAGPLTVEWEGEDPDDDPLTYTVQYSADAGATWQVLAVHVVSPTLTVDDMSTVPGSERALVRVIAADGVHTASDTSDATFTVARSAPEVTITRPDDGTVVAPGNKFLASGAAYDSEDGTLDGSALEWFADDAPAGSGPFAAIGPLAPGTHTITLRAVDTDQQVGEDSITVHVQDLACEDANNVDLVFILDTSPPMAQQFDAACQGVKEVVTALQASGLNVRWRALGVTQGRGCAKMSVRDVLHGSSVDHPSDWGAAVHDVSARYPWWPGAQRIVMTFSNQGPENGDPVQDPGPDREIVKAAIQAARKRQVKVFPVLMLAGLGPQPEPPDMPVAHSLAGATGGHALEWQDARALAADMRALVPTGSCVPSITGVSPVCGFEREDTLTLHGYNLAVGAQLYVGPYLARDVAANADGTRMTFRAPVELLPGRTYDVRVERTGVGGDTLSGAVTFGPCSDRCDGYLPGDIALPMWRIRTAGGTVVFEARATADELTARLYAHDGPMKLVVQEADGTGLASAGVLAGTTGEVTVPTAPGATYLVIALNAHAPATRFRLYAHGAEYLRTADDGDDWAGSVINPGRGENHGAASHPELGFAGRWRDLGPAFAATTWFFDVGPGDDELAVRVWSEGLFGTGHAGMSWLRPDGTVQPLIGPEGATFDHTWRVGDPAPGFWGLRIEAASADPVEVTIVDPDEPDDDVPEILYFFPGYVPQGYSLARTDQPADDWLYFRPDSMVGPPCGPSVLLVPGAAELCVGALHPMDIVVADVANLYGAEVHLLFDKDRLEAVDENGEDATTVTPGPFLDPASGLLGANYVDNEFGLIDYAISLRDPAPPAFGTGVLGTVTFRAKAAGRAEVKVDEAKLSERPLPPAPAARPDTDVRGAVFTTADCYDGGQDAPGTVRGRAVLDGRGDHGGADVSVVSSGGTLTLPEGDYVLSGVAPGDHEIDVRLGGYLRAGPRAFTLGAGASVDLPLATLLGGDCNGDDEIDIVDGGIAARYFGLSEGWADKFPDINADGVVDIFDLVMVGGNFGCTVDDGAGRCQRWERR